PSVTLAADVKLPLSLTTPFADLSSLGTGIEIHVKDKTTGKPIAFDLDYNTLLETPFKDYVTIDLGQLGNFTGFNFSTIVSALNMGLHSLSNAADSHENSSDNSLSFLYTELPFVNIRLRDVLNYATKFTGFLSRLTNNPAANL